MEPAAFMAYFFILLGVLILCSNRRNHSFGVWYPINVSLHLGSHHSKHFLSAKQLPDNESFSRVQTTFGRMEIGLHEQPNQFRFNEAVGITSGLRVRL